jgi:hypothetical protein
MMVNGKFPCLPEIESKLTTQPDLVPRLRMHGALLLFLLQTLMAWSIGTGTEFFIIENGI